MNDTENTYRTGTARPRRSRRGLMAFLLIVIIVLLGLVTVLGTSNLHLIRKLTSSQEETLGISLYEAQTEPAQLPTENATEPMDVAAPTEGLSAVFTPGDFWVTVTGTQGTQGSRGIGLLLTENGYLLAEGLPVSQADSIHVLLGDDRVFPAALVASDEELGLALLQIQGSQLPHVNLNEDPTFRVGDALATNDGQTSSITGLDTWRLENGLELPLLYLDQPQAPGTTLVDSEGKAVAFVFSPSGEQTVALSGSGVRQVFDRLLHREEAEASLGIYGEDVPTLYQAYYDMPAGVYITGLVPGGAAEGRGLRKGDVLVRLEQLTITSLADCQRIMKALRPGQTVTLVVYREGKLYNAQLTLGTKESETP